MNFDLTPWHWIGFSSILFCLELFVGSPGVVLLWIGVAGFVLAIILSLYTINFWLQLILLAGLSVLLCWVGRRVFSSKSSDSNTLNQRSKSLIGTVLKLEHPIKNGKSRVRINDTIWRIEGPDLPAGTKIEVIDVKGNTLIIDVLYPF
jgi:membrane protein implicated in regulation of membrane protease activity